MRMFEICALIIRFFLNTKTKAKQARFQWNILLDHSVYKTAVSGFCWKTTSIRGTIAYTDAWRLSNENRSTSIEFRNHLGAIENKHTMQTRKIGRRSNGTLNHINCVSSQHFYVGISRCTR